jgi:mono/diheme cytochrome c family protein
VRATWLAGSTIVLALAIPIAPTATSTGTEPVTFNKEIVRVFQSHCQTCHRLGEIAPFSLMTYGDAYAHRRKIRHVTQTRKMPPWKPVPGFGDFLEPRRLSEAEIALIERWVTSGAPEGDPSDLPAPREFPYNHRTDYNGDERVDLRDFAIWGRCELEFVRGEFVGGTD